MTTLPTLLNPLCCGLDKSIFKVVKSKGRNKILKYLPVMAGEAIVKSCDRFSLKKNF